VVTALSGRSSRCRSQQGRFAASRTRPRPAAATWTLPSPRTEPRSRSATGTHARAARRVLDSVSSTQTGIGQRTSRSFGATAIGRTQSTRASPGRLTGRGSPSGRTRSSRLRIATAQASGASHVPETSTTGSRPPGRPMGSGSRIWRGSRRSRCWSCIRMEQHATASLETSIHLAAGFRACRNNSAQRCFRQRRNALLRSRDRRGVRAAEGTRLEIAYLPKGGSRVRIPPSPSLASLAGGGFAAASRR
jgi:hypothetical protein